MSPSPNSGDPAPCFELPSADGRSYRLEDFAGQLLILVFIRHLA
ncbi:MAG: redoxin domain-containing protein [Chloroflexi bacterium]|nr:redoxin domain-containing protein [Chloroflexota bacterium]